MRRLFLPAAVLAAAFAVGRHGSPVALEPATWVQASRGTYLVAFVLAAWFRRGRVAAAAAVLAAASEALRLEPALASPTATDVLRPALGFLVPPTLTLLAFLPEWRVVSWAGLWRLGLLGLLGLAVAALVRAPSHALAAPVDSFLRTPWVDAPALAWPQPALASFLLALGLLVWRFTRRGTPLAGGFLGTLVASFLTLGVGADPAATIPRAELFGLAGGAVLVLSQLENAFRLAFEDGLTRLPARRALEERLRQLGRRYAIAMVDVDHFKKLNDRHGHEVGDQVLRLIASRLSTVGGGGRAYRYGGEEFTVVFPGKTAKDVAEHLEELRGAIADRPFSVRGPGRPKRKPKGGRGRSGSSRQLKVTVSLGVADRNASRPRPEQVLKAADQALYRSKKAGRNRLTVA